MTTKKDLNQKELVSELSAMGISPKTTRKEISKTIKNHFLWFRIGDIVATYTPKKKKKVVHDIPLAPTAKRSAGCKSWREFSRGYMLHGR